MRFKKNFSYDRYKIILSGIVLSLFFLRHSPALAQLPDFAVTTAYKLEDKDLTDGDIISLDNDTNTLLRSKTAYDQYMFGVYVQNPKIVFKTLGNDIPIAKSGEVYLNVTTVDGEIARGDYLTSSPVPGMGQKAGEPTGYMIGIAREPFTEKDGTEAVFEDKKIRVGKIKASIGIGPASPAILKASGGLFGTFRQLTSAFAYNLSASKQAEKIVRYILATLVAIVTVFINLYTFGKNVTKGIESIGRNPLARVPIQSMIILNVVLIALVTIGGIALSLAIISL